ncbi:MAG: hypothetical protein QOD99_1859 [Chthoniobacter sp.]|jgi:hypothetical protein|nr:hypothetical protein [Chthoniobacter sp.]
MTVVVDVVEVGAGTTARCTSEDVRVVVVCATGAGAVSFRMQPVRLREMSSVGSRAFGDVFICITFVCATALGRSVL